MIHYLAPDFPRPSWGVALLYHHVQMLGAAGRAARVVHHRRPFHLDWLDLEVPVAYRDDPDFEVRPEDLVVVPEVLAADPWVLASRARRVVFVQNPFLIQANLGGATGYDALGYRRAMAIMPSTAAVVEGHFGVPAPVVPPFVAPAFSRPRPGPGQPRARRVLLVCKQAYRRAGLPDHGIFTAGMARLQGRTPGWELVELEGLPHVQVVRAMQEALFLVNLNCLESFNATVAEAMAAGCVPLCYEAFGGQDYLRDGANAHVFPNGYVYPLLERLGRLMDGYPGNLPALESWRAAGRETAAAFTPDATAAALLEFLADEG